MLVRRDLVVTGGGAGVGSGGGVGGSKRWKEREEEVKPIDSQCWMISGWVMRHRSSGVEL